MQLIRQPAYDTKDRPFMVIWETTQACDLACKHCRAESHPQHDPNALRLEEGKQLIEQILEFGSPHPMFVMTGGDPFKRDDIFELTAYAAERGLPVALSPSGTPLLNRESLGRIKEAGCKAISLSLDASTATAHDAFRGVPGSYEWTVNGWKTARELGLKIQINTTVTRYNLYDLPDIFGLVRDIGAMTWSVFFLVPTGRGLQEDEISPDEYEAVMHFLYDASKFVSLKTTEGHHYKRVVLQRAYLEEHHLPVTDYFPLNGVYSQLMERLAEVVASQPDAQPARDHIRRTPMHVNAADGFVFVSLMGKVFPSGYLPLSGGNIRQTSLKDIYQNSPLFQDLRNQKDLKGRCGACEYNQVCGGSRSRAYAVSGDFLAEEPYCGYQPGSFPFSNQIVELSRT
ncbi:MAG TPA: TIGR04053 family radical SAM/SPASM domain-containing protein [Bellilinea sp.]|nr:TIGR04053 family radical SAM/SPASM domain-containing protein [Bellilinea sp.]